MKLVNGGVYKHKYRTFILIYMHDGNAGKDYNKWGMLNIERHANKGMSCPMFQHYGKKSKFQFTAEELQDYWDSDEWILLDGRLRIEKIDDMSFVEYPNGELEKYVL